MSDERDASEVPLSAGDRADDLVLSLRPVEPTVTVHRGGRARWVVVGVVALMAVVVGLVVALGGDDGGDADARLAGAQAAIEGDQAYRLVATVTGRLAQPDEGEPKQSGTRVEADVVSPERWAALEERFEDAETYPTSERRRIGDELFVTGRTGGDAWQVLTLSPPPDEAAEWAEDYRTLQEEEHDPEEADERRLGLAFFAHVLPIAYDPASVERYVLDATDPAIEEQLDGGGVRLRVTVEPLPEIAAVAETPIEPMDLLLELDAEDRPVAAHFEIAAGGDIALLDLAFSDWGAPLAVEAPPEARVERTPWVDEESLADAEPELLVLPAEVPEGLALVGAEVRPAELGFEDEEAQDCPTAHVEYASQADATAQLRGEVEEDWEPTITLDIGLRSCDEGGRFDDEVGGRPARDVDDGDATVRLDDVVIEVDTTLDAAQLDAVVASFEQVTPAEVIGRFPDWLPALVADRRA